MIAILAFAALAMSNVLEIVEPQASRIAIEAIVKPPVLGASDLAKLGIIARAIPKGTEDYGRREIRMVTDGEMPRCSITPDVIRVSLNVPASRLQAGLGVMQALLSNATLTQENLDAALKEEPSPDYWGAALDPRILPPVTLKPAEAQAIYHRVFRPDALLLTVAGNFTPGAAKEGWTARLDRWSPAPAPQRFPDNSLPTIFLRNPGPVTTIDFIGPKVASNDVALPAKILGLFALGVGKGASLFRVVRERHAWSYRQEAVLEPTPDGWSPRLLVASIPSDDVLQRATTIKAELLDDVNGWTEESRARALGMATGVLRYGVPFNPLYVLGDDPPGTSLSDQTFLSGYWYFKTGRPWDAEALLAAMANVSLDDLKAQASALVQNSVPQVLPGGP